MSILASVLDRLGRAGTILEAYDRHGELAQRIGSRELVDSIARHRRVFAAAAASRSARDDPHERPLDRRVALLFRSEETLEFLVAAFAAMAEGMTVVPLYPTWTEAQQQLYLARYRLRTVAVGEGFRSRVEGWRRLASRVVPVSLRSAKGAARDAAEAPLEPFPRDLPPDHPCAHIFTSGTSGELAKCTVITQANLAAAIENIGRLDFLRPGMDLHCPLSPSHVFAFVVILGFLGLSPRRVIVSDVQYLARLPQEKLGRIDAMILIPVVLNRMRAAFYERVARPVPERGAREGEKADPSLARLARLPVWTRRMLLSWTGAAERAVIARESGSLLGFAAWPLVLLVRRLLGPVVRRRLSSPEFVVVGGAKPGLRAMAFLEVMGIRCLQGWGMTETTGPLAVCRLSDRFRGAFGTCGDLFPGTLAYLDGEELVVEGPQVAAGYVEPDGTVLPLGGRMRTGDQGGFDRRGRLKVLGKASDRITLLNGMNYNPLHYEETIAAFDLRLEHVLEEAVVIGDGQARLGCVFFLREPHTPGEGVRRYLASLLKDINATLNADEQIGPFAISPARIREADVLGPSAKLIRRRVEERWAGLFEERRLELV